MTGARVHKFPGGAVLTCGSDWFLSFRIEGNRGEMIGYRHYGYHVAGGLGPPEVEFITLEGDTLNEPETERQPD